MEDALKFHLEGMLEDGQPLDDVTADFPTDFNREADGNDEECFVLLHITVSPVAQTAQ